MTPLQKIAMGLVIVFLQATFSGYDGLPDPLGWLLVLLGIQGLPRVLAKNSLRVPASTAGLVSAVVYWPSVRSDLAASAEWALSLPQVAFCVLLCHRLSEVAPHSDPGVARRFRGLRNAFIVLGLAPAVLYGGHVDALALPIAIASTFAAAYLVFLLFRVSGRSYVKP